MPTELDRMLAEHACARLATAYSMAIDKRDIDAFVDLWAENGVWHNTRGPMRGPDTIRRYLEGQQQVAFGRHLCTESQVMMLDAEHATGTSYFTFYSVAEPGETRPVTIASASFVGQFFDEYVKTDSGWKFASRRIELTFKVG